MTWPRGDTKFPFERNIFQHEKKNFLSPSGHVIYSIYYINTNEIPNHFTKDAIFICNHSNSDLFTRENKMLSSRVTICFRAKAHVVSFIGVLS